MAMPAELTAATPGTDDDHDTWFVRSTVVLSERMPVAMNCVEAPIASVELEAVTVMETKDGAVYATPLLVIGRDHERKRS